jgi:adenylate kinase family enzyme
VVGQIVLWRELDERSFSRIVVHGASGSGKTTLARNLSRVLGVPQLELDALYHQANWTGLDDELFRQRVSVIVRQPSWVSDGNYRIVRDLLWSRAELIVFLDLPRRQVVSRVLRRTIRRSLTREELWNGNREHLRNLLSADPERNIVLWSWSTHHRYHGVVPAEARERAPQAGVIMLRTRGEVNSFVAAIERRALQGS